MLFDDPGDEKAEKIKEIVQAICEDIGERGEFTAFRDFYELVFEHVDDNFKQYLKNNEEFYE